MSRSTRHLLNSISRGDFLQSSLIIQKYLKGEVVKFDQVLAIPLFDRIPNLTHVYGVEAIHGIVTALLTGFSNSFNVVRPMSTTQIVQCAYDLVMTSQEDQLSLEDYVLFFKGAREGKYGRILDRLDQPTIFEMLEQYRQQRYETLRSLREEQYINFRASGPTDRASEDEEASEDAYRSELNKYYSERTQKKEEEKKQQE